MSKGKIKLKFRRVAEEELVAFAAATMGEEVPPTQGDIPQTREEIEREMKRTMTFLGRMEHDVEKSTFEDLQSWNVRKEIEGRVAEIKADKTNRTLFGLGGFKKTARGELDGLRERLDELDRRKEAHLELMRKANKTHLKLIDRIGRMQDALKKCPEPVAAAVETPAAQGVTEVVGAAVKKISLNFKRVTSAQTEALAEGTLVTGGFDLPEHKASQRRIAAFIEANARLERRMADERQQAEYRRQEEMRRIAEEAAQRRMRQDREQEEHRRSMESGGFGSPRASSSPPGSSRW